MKKNVIAGVLFVALLTGCGVEKKDSEKLNIITEKKETILPTVLPSEVYENIGELPKEIQDILYYEGTFFEVEYQNEYTKESYKVKKDENSWKDLEWERYRVYDLDKDGEKELIVIILESPSKAFVEVFDKQEDRVYAYAFPYRGFVGLYTDGAVLGSSGADVGRFRTMKFDKNKYEETIIAESTSEESEDGQYMKVWYIGDKKVSEEEYYEFISRYHNQEVMIPWSTSPLDEIIQK